MRIAVLALFASLSMAACSEHFACTIYDKCNIGSNTCAEYFVPSRAASADRNSCKQAGGTLLDAGTCPTDNLFGTCHTSTNGDTTIISYYPSSDISSEAVAAQTCADLNGKWSPAANPPSGTSDGGTSDGGVPCAL